MIYKSITDNNSNNLKVLWMLYLDPTTEPEVQFRAETPKDLLGSSTGGLDENLQWFDSTLMLVNRKDKVEKSESEIDIWSQKYIHKELDKISYIVKYTLTH